MGLGQCGHCLVALVGRGWGGGGLRNVSVRYSVGETSHCKHTGEKLQQKVEFSIKMETLFVLDILFVCTEYSSFSSKIPLTCKKQKTVSILMYMRYNHTSLKTYSIDEMAHQIC